MSLWHGVLQVASGKPFGQRPLYGGRKTAIAGILPVDVPTGGKLKTKGSVEGSPWCNRLDGCQQAYSGLGFGLAQASLRSNLDRREQRSDRYDCPYPRLRAHHPGISPGW